MRLGRRIQRKADEAVARGLLTPDEVEVIWQACRAGMPTPQYLLDRIKERRKATSLNDCPPRPSPRQPPGADSTPKGA